MDMENLVLLVVSENLDGMSRQEIENRINAGRRQTDLTNVLMKLQRDGRLVKVKASPSNIYRLPHEGEDPLQIPRA